MMHVTPSPENAKRAQALGQPRTAHEAMDRMRSDRGWFALEPAHPRSAYAALRRHLKTGDLLFCVGSHVGDVLIRAQAVLAGHRVPYSHVAVVRWDPGANRLMVVESVRPMARAVCLSAWLSQYRGRVTFASLKVDGTEAAERSARAGAGNYAVQLAGTPYESLRRMAWDFTLGSGTRTVGNRRLYCSEMARLVVWRALRLSGEMAVSKAAMRDRLPFERCVSPAELFEGLLAIKLLCVLGEISAPTAVASHAPL